jgi:hypothetical protein
MRPINRRALWIVIAIAAVAIAGGAYAAPQSMKQSATKQADRHTIQLREASAVPKLTTIDLGDQGLSPGDQVVTTDGVLDRKGAPAGTLSQVCTLTVPAATLFTSTYDCIGSLVLADGTITFQGPFVPVGAANVDAVSGGTGEFARARGQVTIAAEPDTIEIELG